MEEENANSVDAQQQSAKKILIDDSSVSQLRKVLQEVHVNQRVESATIKFNKDEEASPDIRIDGSMYGGKKT